MSDSPPVSLIIPCRNEVRHVERFAASVRAQDYDGPMEILVADGMSRDGTRDRLAAWAATDDRLRILDNTDKTTPAGLNAAIRASSGEVLLRMDVRAEYAPDYVRTCVDVLRETGASNVGGAQRAKGETSMQRAVALALGNRFVMGGARSHDADVEGPVDTVYLGCWPRQVLFDIGLFDEALVRNQDDELNYRLVKAGHTVWQSPRIRVTYSPRERLAALFRQYQQFGFWKVAVIRKHRLPASWRHLAPGGLVAALALLALAGWVVPAAWTGFWWLLGLYAACALGLGLGIGLRSGADRGTIIRLPLIIAAIHAGYGVGFLQGVIHFGLLRRKYSEVFSRQTHETDTDKEHGA